MLSFLCVFPYAWGVDGDIMYPKAIWVCKATCEDAVAKVMVRDGMQPNSTQCETYCGSILLTKNDLSISKLIAAKVSGYLHYLP